MNKSYNKKKKSAKNKTEKDNSDISDYNDSQFGDIFEENEEESVNENNNKLKHSKNNKNNFKDKYNIIDKHDYTSQGDISDEEADLEAMNNTDSKQIFKDNNEVDNEILESNETSTKNIIESMNLDEINLRIQSILNVLSDYKKNKEEGKSRDSYTTELKQLLMVYYDYNEDIMTLILNLFHPQEVIEFLEASNGQRILTIRSNSLKTKRRELAKILINRGVNLDPLAEWTKVGLKIYDSSVPVGATPEYLSGHYMLQSGSSFLPVLALDVQENEKVLDMCSAPGGKTTYIAQLMKNTGVLVANDLKKERLKSLYFNIHRLGVKNCIITNYDGTKLCKLYNNFDRVLLDAPCSGLGVISKDPSVKVNRVSINTKNIYLLKI